MTSPKLCEECKEKPLISPNHRLCASCMAIKSNKARKQRNKTTAKEKMQKVAPPKGKVKSSPHGNMEFILDFEKYPPLLDKVTELAEEEMRPVDLQIFFMLREYLKGLEGGRPTAY